MAGEVFGDFVPSVTSATEKVVLPRVAGVTPRLFVPEARAAFAGSVALGSLEVRPTVSVTVLTTFQLASTALTVTLKGVHAVWALGAPVLPAAVPGAAVSPGANNCNFT